MFCAISLEETIGLHELTSRPLSAILPATGILFHTWIVLGILFASIVALFYVRFLLHLPRTTRKLFVLAAALYVGGVLGMETIRGVYNELYGVRNMTAQMMKTFEEFCQMLGITVFIYSLLDYIGEHIKAIRVYVIH
jgi:predicted permease